MQIFKKLFFVAIIFTLVTVGCKKTEDDPVDDTPVATQTCYMNKMDYGVDGYSAIVYNSDNLISSVVDYNADGTADGYVTSFTYNGTKLLAMTSADNGTVETKFEFKYSSSSTPDSAIIWSDLGNGTLERAGAYSLTFNGDKIVKVEMSYEYMGQSLVVSKNEFTYSSDNMTEVKNYQFGASMQLELESTIAYEYDSKMNAMHGVGLDFFFFDSDVPFVSVNNITKCTYKDATGSVDQSMSYTNAIEYNSNNYPTMITTNYDDGSDIEVVTYTYDCQ